MSENDVNSVEPQSPDPAADPPSEISSEDFRTGFGEELEQALDINTWLPGGDLNSIYGRIESEVQEAVAREDAYRDSIRNFIFPKLGESPAAPKGAGWYKTDLATLEKIHRGLLFNGKVEACDGTVQSHDTLPLTIFQAGVCLVSYQGDQGTWSQRLYRRDLRIPNDDPMAEMVELLQRRAARGGLNQPSQRDSLTELAGRGIMAYAERKILLHRSVAAWRMGHGNPAPYELITGSGNLDFMVQSTKVIRELVEQHQKFIFVASEPADRLLLTIGNALNPLEFAIVKTLKEQIERTVEGGHYRQTPRSDMNWDGQQLTHREWIRKFRDVVGPKVVVGVFRASALAPPQVFYAHEDHAEVAANIAIADSILQDHRGFPLLIDLAHHVCSSVFGKMTLAGPASVAYTNVGVPWKYLSERASRYDLSR